jgi:hypothetical protein
VESPDIVAPSCAGGQEEALIYARMAPPPGPEIAPLHASSGAEFPRFPDFHFVGQK